MDCYYGQPQPLRFVPNPCIPSSSSSNNPIYPFTTGGEAGGRTRPGLYLMTGGNEPAFPVPGWAAANPPTKKILACPVPPAARPTPPTKKTLARSSPPAAAPAVQRPPTLATHALPFLGQQSLDSMAHAAAVCYHGAVAPQSYYPHPEQQPMAGVACEPQVVQPQALPEIIPDSAVLLKQVCGAQLRQLADPNPRIAAAALAALPGAAVPACTWLPAEKGAEKNASTVPLPIVPLAALLGNLELDQGNRMPKVEKSGRSTTRKLYVRRTDTGKWLCAETNKWVTPGGRVEAVPWTLSGGPKGIVGSTIAYLKHGNNSITLKYIDGRVKLENPDGSHTGVNLVVHMRPSRATEEIARIPAVLLFTKAKPEEPEPKAKEHGRADETKGQTKDYLVMDLEPVVRNFTELTTVLGGSGEADLPLLLWGLEKPLREFLREDRVPEHVTQQLERKLRALLLLGQGTDLGMGMHWDRPTSTSKALWSDTAGDEAAAPHQHHTQ